MAEDQYNNIGWRFRSIRKHLNLGQDEFAKLTGLNQSQVSEVERGRRNITPAIYLALEDSVKVNRKWLETGYGNMFMDEKTENLSEPVSSYGIISALQETISAQKKLIERLEEENNRLKVEIEIFKGKDSRVAG